MERLTGKFRGRTGLVDYLNVSCNKICNRSFCEDCPIEKAFEKLAHYEDLEEQGLLRKVEQGEWIKQTRCIDTWSCTNCGEVEKVPTCMGEPIYNFCPNCGAKMKVVE